MFFSEGKWRGSGAGGSGRSEVKGNCGWDVLYGRKIYFQFKKKKINIIQNINRIKDTNRMIMSKDTEEGANKIQYFFKIKILKNEWLNIVWIVY